MNQSDQHTDQDISYFAEKARRFISAQDRSKMEIEEKLKSWRCAPEWIGQIIHNLSVDGFIDELRFAKNFARGKFRIKNWGRMKITAALYQHRIPQALIKIALEEIDENEYRHTLMEILQKKWKIVNGDRGTKINKTAAFAISKGFESTLVFDILGSKNKEQW